MAASAAPGRQWGLFVDGVETDALGGEFYRIDEPATGEPLAIASAAGAFDAERAVDVARRALGAAWGATSPEERSRLLHALADRLVACRDELAELEARNVGTPIASVRLELAAAVDTFRFFGTAIAAIGGRSGALGRSLLAYTLKQPVGVCVQILPWTHPLLVAAQRLAPALAAGCSVVLKPDPRTPLTALRLAELTAEVGFAPGAVNVVPAGPEVGAYLVEHLAVDRVTFTGSIRSGVEVMRLAAASLKRLGLELGGKNSTVVFADADLERAVPAAVRSAYYAAGQSCQARSRILVERPLHDEFVARFRRAAARLRVGDPLDSATQVGPLISEAHCERVHRFVEHALVEGAEVALGGELAAGGGAFYPPTLLTGVGGRHAVAQEELLGPVATVTAFDGESEAVRLANDVSYGLAASLWTGDPARGHRLAPLLEAATVEINVRQTSLPGARQLGLEGLEPYLEPKSVLVDKEGSAGEPGEP